MVNAIHFITVASLTSLLMTTAHPPIDGNRNSTLLDQLGSFFSSNNRNRNNILFERFEFIVLNESYFSYTKMEFRMVARNVFKLNTTLILTRSAPQLWFHFVLNRKYVRYQVFLIDIWEDACAFFSGSISGPLSRMIFDNVQGLGMQFSFKLMCPFVGVLMVTHPGMNASEFVSLLLPAGRYRLDTVLASEKNDGLIACVQFFFTISDFRIWFE